LIIRQGEGIQQRGAKLVRGDFEDIESLQLAMRGMNSIFLNLAFKQQKNVIEAARASHTVLVMIASSVVKASEHKSFPRWGSQWSMYDYWLTKDAL
jgi:uncharacterized protein YbjT (DUF2867 family)